MGLISSVSNLVKRGRDAVGNFRKARKVAKSAIKAKKRLSTALVVKGGVKSGPGPKTLKGLKSFRRKQAVSRFFGSKGFKRSALVGGGVLAGVGGVAGARKLRSRGKKKSRR